MIVIYLLLKVAAKKKKTINPVDKEKRRNLRAVYLHTMNFVKNQNEELKGRPGQQRFAPPESYVPSFIPEVVMALRSGNKKAILAIIHEISADMALKGDSGNTTYYRKIQTHVLMAYSHLNNALFRNECRRRHRKLQKKNHLLQSQSYPKTAVKMSLNCGQRMGPNPERHRMITGW